MMCPLFSVTPYAIEDRAHPSLIDCLKQECAWWFEGTDRCALLELAGATCAVAEHLSVIREYGPGNEPEHHKR